MDSFYDGPRRAPPPMSRGTLNANPVVPEISVLAPTNAPRNTFTPYTPWKSQQQTAAPRHFIPSNKENFAYLSNSQQNNSILKKQVRFESPTNQAKIFESGKVVPQPKGTNMPSFAKGSYLADLPSRKLDLSVIDLTKNTPPSAKKVKNRPRNYKEFLEQQAVETRSQKVIEDDSVIDIFNYKRKSQISDERPKTPLEQNIDNDRECRGRFVPQVPQAEPQQEHFKSKKEPDLICNCSSKKSTSDDDLTTKDLLKIITQQSQQISQQNAQLLVLQQQISELVLMQKNQELARQKSMSSPCCSRERCGSSEDDYCNRNVDRGCGCNRRERCGERSSKMRCVTSSQHEANVDMEPQQNCADGMARNKNHLPNFSIGMTTSFEVAFRNKPAQNRIQSEQIPFEKPTVEIQEITEEDNTDKNQIEQFNVPKNTIRNKDTLVDTSMVFKEPIRVREQCPSPEPSIRIDMNDFDDSDSEDSSEMEASFYRNLMTQVNKILKKAQIETAEEVMGNVGATNLNNRTMNKIKEATLRQLRKIGVNLPQMEDSREYDSNEVANERSYDQEDISLAVTQLLMKYLPADHLAKVSSKPKTTNPERVLTPKDKGGAIRNRPEFSFATVQYMKKYNLIANSNKEFNLPHKEKQAHSPKILDISKLKQQPKLL